MHKSNDRKTPWYYLLLRVVLVLLGISVGLFALLLFALNRLHLCQNTIERTVLSPDGKLKAVAFVNDCGAGASVRQGVSIMRVNDTLSDDDLGNVFAMGGDEMEGDIQPKWTNDHEVVIYNQSSHFWISKKVTLWTGWGFTTVKLRHGPVQEKKH